MFHNRANGIVLIHTQPSLHYLTPRHKTFCDFLLQLHANRNHRRRQVLRGHFFDVKGCAEPQPSVWIVGGHPFINTDTLSFAAIHTYRCTGSALILPFPHSTSSYSQSVLNISPTSFLTPWKKVFRRYFGMNRIGSGQFPRAEDRLFVPTGTVLLCLRLENELVKPLLKRAKGGPFRHASRLLLFSSSTHNVGFNGRDINAYGANTPNRNEVGPLSRSRFVSQIKPKLSPPLQQSGCLLALISLNRVNGFHEFPVTCIKWDRWEHESPWGDPESLSMGKDSSEIPRGSEHKIRIPRTVWLRSRSQVP